MRDIIIKTKKHANKNMQTMAGAGAGFIIMGGV
jgi:hypothetical protein